MNEWLDEHREPRESVLEWSKIYKKDLHCRGKCDKCKAQLRLKKVAAKLLKSKDKKKKRITSNDLIRLVKVMR